MLFVALFTIGLIAIATKEQQPAAPRRGGAIATWKSLTLDVQPRTDRSANRIDFSGNVVDDAVATYKPDADGSLYEEHSPGTELPHIASPKS